MGRAPQRRVVQADRELLEVRLLLFRHLLLAGLDVLIRGRLAVVERGRSGGEDSDLAEPGVLRQSRPREVLRGGVERAATVAARRARCRHQVPELGKRASCRKRGGRGRGGGGVRFGRRGTSVGTRRPASASNVAPSAHLAVPPARLRTTARPRASSRDAAQRHRREARFALRTRGS